MFRELSPQFHQAVGECEAPLSGIKIKICESSERTSDPVNPLIQIILFEFGVKYFSSLAKLSVADLKYAVTAVI